MRTRFCMVPVSHSSCIPASTSGIPVRPICHAASTSSSSGGHGKASNFGLMFSVAMSGWTYRLYQENSRHPTSVRNFPGFSARSSAVCHTVYGLISPQRRCGDSPDVAGLAGTSRSWA